MYDEVLEMLHMGLQKVKTLPSLENKCFIGNFFTMHQYLARTYSTLGDYEKSAFYTLATKMVRNQHSSYLRKTNTKEFKLEEKTFLDMKMISNMNIPMNDIYNVRASVHNQILALEEDNPIDQNEIRLFRMNCDINIEMNVRRIKTRIHYNSSSSHVLEKTMGHFLLHLSAAARSLSRRY